MLSFKKRHATKLKSSINGISWIIMKHILLLKSELEHVQTGAICWIVPVAGFRREYSHFRFLFFSFWSEKFLRNSGAPLEVKCYGFFLILFFRGFFFPPSTMPCSGSLPKCSVISYIFPICVFSLCVYVHVCEPIKYHRTPQRHAGYNCSWYGSWLAVSCFSNT